MSVYSLEPSLEDLAKGLELDPRKLVVDKGPEAHDLVATWQELNEPENRRIIQAYKSLETAGLDSAYSSLCQTHPSLTAIVAGIRQAGDPAAELEKTRAHIREMLDFAQGYRAIVEFSGLRGRAADDCLVQTSLEGFAKLEQFCGLYEHFTLHQGAFYVKLARAGRSVSSSRGLTLDDALMQPCMDEALRIVFPAREQAESHFRMGESYEKLMFDSIRTLYAFAETLSDPADAGLASEKPSNTASLIPPVGDIDALFAVIRDYRQRQLDRTYSQGQE